MDDQVAERDPYSDDDLDAILSQVPGRPDPNPQLPSYKSPHRPVGYHLNAAHTSVPIPPGVALGGRHNAAHEPSSDYGDFDDEMLDGEIFDAAETPFAPAAIQPSENHSNAGESTQREQWRQQRYGNPIQDVNPQVSKHVNGPSYGALPAQQQPTARKVFFANAQQSPVNGQFTASATEAQNYDDSSELHAQVELVRVASHDYASRANTIIAVRRTPIAAGSIGKGQWRGGEKGRGDRDCAQQRFKDHTGSR